MEFSENRVAEVTPWHRGFDVVDSLPNARGGLPAPLPD